MSGLCPLISKYIFYWFLEKATAAFRARDDAPPTELHRPGLKRILISNPESNNQGLYFNWNSSQSIFRLRQQVASSQIPVDRFTDKPSYNFPNMVVINMLLIGVIHLRKLSVGVLITSPLNSHFPHFPHNAKAKTKNHKQAFYSAVEMPLIIGMSALENSTLWTGLAAACEHECSLNQETVITRLLGLGAVCDLVHAGIMDHREKGRDRGQR